MAREGKTARRNGALKMVRAFHVGLLSLLLLLAVRGVAWASEARQPAGPVAKVVIHPEPVVSSEAIRLGDIAQIESSDSLLAARLAALEVGRAALPGQSRVVTVGTLRLRMRQARLPERQIEIEAEADAIPVLTRHQTLDGERLKATVERWYEKHSILPQGTSLHLTINAAEVIVPWGDVEIHVALDAPRWGNVAVPLEIRVDGRPYKRIYASVEALLEQPVWVTTRPLARGEEVEAGDVQQVKRRFSQPIAGPPDLSQPVRTTRYVREGAALTWENVETVPQVKKGEQVLIVARKGDVVVQVAGEAMEDGRIGETLAVRNLASGNVVYGTLTPDGEVLVEVW